MQKPLLGSRNGLIIKMYAIFVTTSELKMYFEIKKWNNKIFTNLLKISLNFGPPPR
jgi:hypothetical protein